VDERRDSSGDRRSGEVRIVIGVSSQIQRLDFEIQAFLDQTYEYNQSVGACEIGIDVKEHELTLEEIGILAVYGRADGLACSLRRCIRGTQRGRNSRQIVDKFRSEPRIAFTMPCRYGGRDNASVDATGARYDSGYL